MKTRVLTFLILSMLLMTSLSFGQNKNFMNGKIRLVNNETLLGEVEVPTDGSQKFVKYKENNEVKEISSDEISALEFYSENGETYYFDRIRSKRNVKKEKLSKAKVFFLAVRKTEQVSFYISPAVYKVTSEREIKSLYSFYVGKDLPTFDFWMKKEGENYASLLGTTSPSPTMFGLNRILKITSKVLLADNPDLVQRIQNGELKHQDLPEIIDVYISGLN